MLIKCVCSSCGHSYLGDDEAGEIYCPRCDALNEGFQNPSDIPDAPARMGGYEPPSYSDAVYDEHGITEPTPLRFVAKAPPPMFITRERLVRGFFFGSIVALITGAIIGAAMTAISVDIPGVAIVLVALIAGGGVRAGFGGRSARQTRLRAALTCAVVVAVGAAGIITGSWGIARFTGSRADQTRTELAEGLKALVQRYEDASDAGVEVLLKDRVEETRRLQRLSDPELEDYLWVQQAQLNQPLLAYAKLQFTREPIVKLGEKSKPVRMKEELTLGIRAGVILLGMILAARAVRPKYG